MEQTETLDHTTPIEGSEPLPSAQPCGCDPKMHYFCGEFPACAWGKASLDVESIANEVAAVKLATIVSELEAFHSRISRVSLAPGIAAAELRTLIDSLK